MLVGTPEQAIETLEPWLAAGTTYLIGYFADVAYDSESRAMFATQVAPAVA